MGIRLTFDAMNHGGCCGPFIARLTSHGCLVGTIDEKGDAMWKPALTVRRAWDSTGEGGGHVKNSAPMFGWGYLHRPSYLTPHFKFHPINNASTVQNSVCKLLLAGDWIHGSSRPKQDKGNEQINLPPFNARIVQFALIKVSSWFLQTCFLDTRY